MSWRRGKQKQATPALHRGRIFRGGDYWRYQCNCCTYGAGTIVPLHGGFSWLVSLATQHADPSDVTRR